MLDAPAKISLKDDLGEHRIQADLVSAIRGSGETDQFLRPEVVEDLPVSIRRGVVCLVADDQAKFIRPEAVQTAHKGLNRRADDILIVALECRTLDAEGTVEVFTWLLYQLLTVGKDQHTLTMPREVCKGHRLAEPCCHLSKVGTRRLRIDRVDAVDLIVS